MISHVHNHQRICLVGATSDIGNLGVTALCHAAVNGLAERGVEDISVFDHTDGVRHGAVESSDGPTPVMFLGAVNSGGIFQHSNLWNIRISARLGGLNNPAALAMKAASAVLDLSSGDGFTDVYGKARFQAVTLPKLIAIESGKPLVLLPQTFGPFNDPACKAKARYILQHTSQAWARDPESYAALKELLGNDFDPHLHHEGVDMAFGLQPTMPIRTPDWLQELTQDRDRKPLVGLNVSGMLYSRANSREAFGLQSDYGHLCQNFLRWLMNQTDAQVMLVPHLLGTHESDLTACQSLLETVGPQDAHRVRILGNVVHPGILKWYVGHCDYFIAGRLHAGIASLSQGIPTTALAYNSKFASIFASCQQRNSVIDLRHHDRETAMGLLIRNWCNRQATRDNLIDPIKQVRLRWAQQFDAIVMSQPATSRDAHQ